MADLQERLKALLAPSGFDLVAPFTAQAYNACRQPGVPKLPTFGRSSTLAFVIGNTKALWRCFLRHLAEHPEAIELKAPLDTYTQARIEAAILQCCSKGGLSTEVRWGFKTSAEVGFVDLLRAAQTAGLAFLDNEIHLCTSPVYGPWIAFRAVVTVDADGTTARLHAPLLSDPFPELRPKLLEMMEELRAMGAMDQWMAHWRDWANLRKLAGSAAQQHAYDDRQIEYHYTQSRAALEAALKDYLAV